jgi:hypothetical protein
MGGESGPAELWKDPQQRPAEHTDVIEAIGLSPEDAVDRLLNKQLNWEVQKTNDPRVVHLLADIVIMVTEHPDGRVATNGRVFLTVVELPFGDLHTMIISVGAARRADMMKMTRLSTMKADQD